MRYKITLITDGGLSLPLDYHEYLTAAIYSLLGRSDPAYAAFLHDEGYGGNIEGADSRRYKLFTYSQLLSTRRRIDAAHDRIIFSGPISWLISSPVEEFARHVAGGMLAEGAIQVGPSRLRIDSISILPMPRFTEEMRFTCLSPIVASVPRPAAEGGGTTYLRPLEDALAFSEAIRKNLIAKHRVLHGSEPADTSFEMTFDADYLARAPHGGTRLTRFKGTNIRGAYAPFAVRGNAELIRVGYAAGFGGKGALGHGCVETIAANR